MLETCWTPACPHRAGPGQTRRSRCQKRSQKAQCRVLLHLASRLSIRVFACSSIRPSEAVARAASVWRERPIAKGGRGTPPHPRGIPPLWGFDNRSRAFRRVRRSKLRSRPWAGSMGGLPLQALVGDHRAVNRSGPRSALLLLPHAEHRPAVHVTQVAGRFSEGFRRQRFRRTRAPNPAKTRLLERYAAHHPMDVIVCRRGVNTPVEKRAGTVGPFRRGRGSPDAVAAGLGIHGKS
jgi:hypothetical protein